MSETAAQLVDHVLPHVPVCQWVLSLAALSPVPGRLRRALCFGGPRDLLGRNLSLVPLGGQEGVHFGERRRGASGICDLDPALLELSGAQCAFSCPGVG